MTIMNAAAVSYTKHLFNGEWYVKQSDYKMLIEEMLDLRDEYWNRKIQENVKKFEEWKLDYDKLHQEKKKWKLAYSNQEKIANEGDLKIAKLKSIIADYENKITKYLEKIDIQQATIISMKTEPVIECDLEPTKATQKCNGLKCKGQFQPLELFMKNGKTLKNCKICRDHKCELDKKSRNKSKNIDLNELD